MATCPLATNARMACDLVEIGNFVGPAIRRGDKRVAGGIATPGDRVGAGRAAVALVQHEHPGGGTADGDRILQAVVTKTERRGRGQRITGKASQVRGRAGIEQHVELFVGRDIGLGQQKILHSLETGPCGNALVGAIAGRRHALHLQGQLEARSAARHGEERREHRTEDREAAHQKRNPSESRLIAPSEPPSV